MDEAILQELEISGIRVLKVKKGQQIVYKLANNVSVAALPEGKRHEIMQSIMRLHAQDSANRVGVPASQSVPSLMQRMMMPTRVPTFTPPTTEHRAKNSTTGSSTLSVLLAAKLRYCLTHFESEQQSETRTRLAERLRADHAAVATPNIKDSFSCLDDAVDRLLPYHVFQYPDAEFDVDANQSHEAFVRMNAEVERRYLAIQKRMLDIRRRDSKRQEMRLLCERMIMNDEKAELEELRRAYGHLLHGRHAVHRHLVQPVGAEEATQSAQIMTPSTNLVSDTTTKFDEQEQGSHGTLSDLDNSEEEEWTEGTESDE